MMDDLISRQAVLENAFAIYTHECGLVEVVGVATIKDLPSVKPQEPKTGHWIYIGNGHNGLNKCSECGGERKMFDELEKYCANCGTKMIELNRTCQKTR